MRITELDSTKKTINPRVRPKILENFVLTKISSLDELKAFTVFPHFQELEKAINDLFEKLPVSSEVTTYSFVYDISLIQELLLKPHNALLTPKLSQTASALVLRIKRFRQKFYICLKLNTGASVRYNAIDNALSEILRSLATKRIHTTFSGDTGSAYHFNLESTFSVIAAELREAEKMLRRLLEPLSAALGTSAIANADWSRFFHFINELSVCMTVPMPDWHYLFKFINCPPLMEAVQLKQWNGYMVEIRQLLSILFLLAPDKVNLSAIKDDTRNGINQKLSTLQLSGKPLTSSTFTAIITALNRFVPQLWFVTFVSLMEAGVIYKNPANVPGVADQANSAPNEPKK